jgi:hypothetical protein
VVWRSGKIGACVRRGAQDAPPPSPAASRAASRRGRDPGAGGSCGLRVRALDGGHLGDVRQLRRGRHRLGGLRAPTRSVIGSGVELKERL